MPKGKLKPSEEEFIRENALEKSDAEIGKILERDPRTIANYRKKIGIVKKQGGKVISGKPDNKKPTVAQKNAAHKTEVYKMQLKSSIYYKTLKNQLEEDELSLYEEGWGDLSNQFSDIVATERRQIDEYLKAEILGNRILQSIKMVNDEIEGLAERIEEHRGKHDLENDDIAQEQDDYLMTMVARMAAASQAMTKDYKESVDLRRRILEDLHAKRKTRIDQLHQKGFTILQLIEDIKKNELRELKGREMELIRLAKEKKKGEWRKQHIFPDGAKDVILLDEHSDPPEMDSTKNVIDKYLTPDLLNNPQDIDIQEG